MTGRLTFQAPRLKQFAMDQDLKFRYQQNDGRNTLIAAAITILAAPLVTFVGWPLVIGAAGVTVGYLIARLSRH